MTDFNQKTHDTDVGSHGGQSRQMMEVFENQEFGSIRVLQEAGKTFFCASDVAKALGYVNPYAAVKRHCRGPLTKREGVVQKVNQYGDAGEQVVEISFMNNAVTGWRAFSNPRYFPEPYRRQKGWERIRNDNEPDNSMDGFQEIPTEEMEQLGLPEEWLKQK